MPQYFSNFPKIYYDAVGNDDYKVVTHLLRRIQIKKGLLEIGSVFDEINLSTHSTPEIVSEQMYGTQDYYWVVLLVNNIKDRFYDWPLTEEQFEKFVNDKYANPNAVHHYEITQTSGPTSSIDDSHKIQVNSTTPNSTAITNYEYERRIQDKKARIRVLRPDYLELFVEEFKSLMEV
tara:strand:+ start:599 stop:1129 length:531 start_codon:yes stop_codon:yes gene_type:complete